MTKEHDSGSEVWGWLLLAGGLAVWWLLSDDGEGGDAGESDDTCSSYPPWEDAMNHRYPGSYGSKTGG